jgi:hypothetical protein
MALSLINKTQLDPNISDLVSGYGLNFFYPIDNPSGFATGLSFDPVNFIKTGQSGLFYPATNPNNYITGVDLSSYVQTGLFYSFSGTYDNFVSNFNSLNYATQSYVINSISSINQSNVTTGVTGQFFSASSGVELNTNIINTGSNLSGIAYNINQNLISTGSTLSGQTYSLYLSISSFSGDFVKSGLGLSGQIQASSGTFNTTGYKLTGSISDVNQSLILSGKNISNAITSFSGTFNQSGAALSGLVLSSGAALSGLVLNSGAALSGLVLNSGSALSGYIGSVAINLFTTGGNLTNSIIQTGNNLSGLILKTGSALSGFVVQNDQNLQSQINTILGNLFNPLIYPLGVASAWVSFNAAYSPISCTGSTGANRIPNSTGEYFVNSDGIGVTPVRLYCNNSAGIIRVNDCITVSQNTVKPIGNKALNGCYIVTGTSTTGFSFDLPGRPTALITGYYSGLPIAINSKYNVPLVGYRDAITGGIPVSPYVFNIYPWNTIANTTVMPDSNPCVMATLKAVTPGDALNTPPAMLSATYSSTQTKLSSSNASPSSYVTIAAKNQCNANVLIFTNKTIS